MTTTRIAPQLPQDYQPSEGEYNNIVYLTILHLTNLSMRQADYAVCQRLCPRADLRGPHAVDLLVREVTEYCWDHLMGEPEDVTVDSLFDALVPVFEEWFLCTDLEGRSDTSIR